MRAPNHLEIKETCREVIRTIMSKLKVSSSEKIIFDEQGWVNVTVFVGDEFVVRFNARDAQLPKFQREKKAFKLLENVVPVPELVVFDDSKTISPYDYMVCKKIPGENLEEKWSALPEKDRETLAYKAGQLLAKIHSKEIDSFGEISAFGPFLKTKDWAHYLRHTLNYHLSEAMELNLFSAVAQKQFVNLFESQVKLFDQLKTPNLIHGDFHLGNLLFLNQDITGVLDFEWSCAGDPLFDICNNLRDMDSKWPGSQVAFNKGYGVQNFSDEELAKMRVYSMIKSIELCVVSKRFFPEEECEEYVQITENSYAPRQ